MSEITTEQHYKITLSNGSTYYGRTTQHGNLRYNEHTSDVRRGKHGNKHIQEVYDKYGYDDWVHEWLGWETGDLEHHRKIEFGYVQADPKSINIRKGYYALLSEEQLKKYFHEQELRRIDKYSPEELEEFRRKNRERAQRNRDNKKDNKNK